MFWTRRRPRGERSAPPTDIRLRTTSTTSRSATRTSSPRPIRQRYPLFYNAIHAAFPNLQIIATSTDTGGSPYNVLDEHFYDTPQWFEANSNYFDTVARGSSEIFIGEYASNQGSPTNDMESALGDASWLLGLERNSDLVTMSSYAPLWANVNGIQWTPDLIGFNNTTAYGSPSYYAQLILSQNHGTTVVSDTVSGAGGLQTLVTKTGTTYYVTVINTLGAANTTTINLAGVANVSSDRDRDEPDRPRKHLHQFHHQPDQHHADDVDHLRPGHQLQLHVRRLLDHRPEIHRRCRADRGDRRRGKPVAGHWHDDQSVGPRCRQCRRIHSHLHMVGHRARRGKLQRQRNQRRQKHHRHLRQNRNV